MFQRKQRRYHVKKEAYMLAETLVETRYDKCGVCLVKNISRGAKRGWKPIPVAVSPKAYVCSLWTAEIAGYYYDGK
jgi:hypothetical protein